MAQPEAKLCSLRSLRTKTALTNLPLQLHGKVTLVKIYLLRRNRHFEIKIRCQKEMQFFPVPNTTSWSMKMQI